MKGLVLRLILQLRFKFRDSTFYEIISHGKINRIIWKELPQRFTFQLPRASFYELNFSYYFFTQDALSFLTPLDFTPLTTLRF